ncbi:MAG: NADH-quinone oxidoreductase subunit M [Epsilonproteobacteria bacterium]|nr:NADH-quinone oxidoreductase subunit M [Campylobacterota bacterium]
MANILSVLIFFPLLAGLLGFIVDKRTIRVYGIAVTAIEFLLSLWLWFSFDTNNPNLQFIEFIPLVSDFGINYYLGVDGISLFLVVLTTFMTLIGVVGLTIEKNLKNLIVSLLFLEVAMVGVFVSLDVIIFYLFWEFSLVPMLYIIGAWGGEKRLYAAIKFFIYTFAGSLVMLVGILIFAKIYHDTTGVWSFSLTDWYRLQLSVSAQSFLFWLFFLGFAIKVPMFPFHTWLPYAHGQAPTIGSVILAAVLLKMGTYGFVRFSLPLFPDAAAAYITPIAVISIIMIIYTAMVAYAQEDMKQVIAYSSISHMGVIMIGTFALNTIGIGGAIFLMLSHGIVSGALFLLVGVIYDRRHTKLMSEFGGLASVMPKYALIFGIMLMASVGLPLTIGFVGEYLSLAGFFKISPTMTILAGTSIIVGAIYMLSLYKKSFFGPLTKEENKKLKDLNARELWALVPLTLVVIWLGVYPKPILKPIDVTVNGMVKFMHKKAKLEETKSKIYISTNKEAK